MPTPWSAAHTRVSILRWLARIDGRMRAPRPSPLQADGPLRLVVFVGAAAA